MGRLSLLVGVPGLRRVRLVVVALLVVSPCLLSRSALACGEFTRSFESVVEGTPTGPSGEEVPFGKLRCIAADTGEGGNRSGNYWIGESSHAFDEFSSSNEFLKKLAGSGTNGCAFDYLSGELLSVGQGEWVAADNSGGLDNGDAYFAHAGNGETRGFVERVKPSGKPGGFEPAGFTCSASNAKEYVSGNRLTGRPEWEGKPAESWGFGQAVAGVAVDSGSEATVGVGAHAGDIYVINDKAFHSLEVDVFTSAGCFERVITGTREVENNGKKEVEELFSGSLQGVAVDPTDGDVLIKGAHGSAASVIGEFTPEGVFLGALSGRSREDPFGERDSEGVAVGGGGDLYVAADEVKEDPESHVVLSERFVVDVFGPGAFYPGGVTGGASVVRGGVGGVVLNGKVRGVKDATGNSLALSECFFEYVSEEEFVVGGFSGGVRVPCVLDGSGLSPVGDRLEEKYYGVEAGVGAGGLVAGRVYRFRVVVGASVGERGGVKVGDAESFVGPGAPLVGGVSVGDISSSFAVFRGEVDPSGVDTRCWFEYVDEVSGVVGVTGVVDVGSGVRGVSVVRGVGGLLPGRLYGVRVFAENGVGSTVGVGGSGGYDVFMTLPASGQVMPDGRGFEMLTPPDKGDAEDVFGTVSEALIGENQDVGLSSVSGNEFLFHTQSRYGSFPASGENVYRFLRGEGGWVFSAAALPSLGIQGITSSVYDPGGFSVVGVSDVVGGKAENNGDILVGPPGGPYTTVMLSTSAYNDVVGASRGLGRVVVESDEHVMPTVPLPLCVSAQESLVSGQEKRDKASRDLYEWSAGRQCLSLVNARSESEGGGLVSGCGAVLGQGAERAGGTHGAVSGDGSRIVFTAPDPSVEGSGCWVEPGNKVSSVFTPQVYMRLEERVPGEAEGVFSTVEVSAPEQGVHPPAMYPAVFVGASEDGSRVFFVTRTELTKRAVELGTQTLELYEYNVGGSTEAKNWWERKLVLVSAGAMEGVSGGVESVPAVSADGSSVYFNGSGELAPGFVGGLYRFDTGTGETTRVAPGGEYPAHAPIAWFQNPSISPGEDGLDVSANYYTTSNGRFLLFASSGEVTGYHSDGKSELYRYDATLPVSKSKPGSSDNPVCVSCNPNGTVPLVGSEFARSSWMVGSLAGTPSRPLSEEGSNGPEEGRSNGSYVFFDTAESLVPQATNGKVDVYEWEANGTGSCTEAKGCVRLIGSGQDSISSFFLGSSADGSNLFLGTHAQLVSRDTDTQGDLYDARRGGGEAQLPSSVPCEGDACSNPPLPPLFQTPASVTFSGAGNLASEPPPPRVAIRCSKGKKLSHGRCVRSSVSRKAGSKKSKGKKQSRSKRVSGGGRVGK